MVSHLNNNLQCIHSLLVCFENKFECHSHHSFLIFFKLFQNACPSSNVLSLVLFYFYLVLYCMSSNFWMLLSQIFCPLISLSFYYYFSLNFFIVQFFISMFPKCKIIIHAILINYFIVNCAFVVTKIWSFLRFYWKLPKQTPHSYCLLIRFYIFCAFS